MKKKTKKFRMCRYFTVGCLAVVMAFFLWGSVNKSLPVQAALYEYGDEAINKIGNSYRDKNGRYILKVGDTMTFTATYSVYSYKTGIRWTISNPSVLQYAGGSSSSYTRTVRGVSPGVSTLNGIITSYYFGPNFTQDVQDADNPFPIHVVEPLSGATLSHTTMALAPGATGKIDLMTITPDSLYSLFVTERSYASSDTSVATVDNSGNIQALKNGTTTISFMGDGRALASCVLTVSDGTNNSNNSSGNRNNSVSSGGESGMNRGKVKELSLLGSRLLRVQIKRDTNASGYQIQYSTNKKFKKNKTKTVNLKKNKKTTKVLKKLKKGKKYYIRVRSFKKTRSGNSTTKVFGRWSKIIVSKKIK